MAGCGIILDWIVISNSGNTILKYVEHFSEVFEKTNTEAALAAGIFHREEVSIEAVKEHMRDEGIEAINIDSISAQLKRPFRMTWEGFFFVHISTIHLDTLRTHSRLSMYRQTLKVGHLNIQFL